jgi:hypothetical protein
MGFEHFDAALEEVTEDGEISVRDRRQGKRKSLTSDMPAFPDLQSLHAHL